jgi:hypothetical protein
MTTKNVIYIVMYDYDYEGYSLENFATKAFYNEADAIKYKEQLETAQEHSMYSIDVIIEKINVE